MDLEHAKTLVALVETGSVSAAADALDIARPTIRRRLKMLEDGLGIPLVVLDGKGVHPTEAGHLYVAHARRLIRDQDALYDLVRNLGAGSRGTLDIAMPVGFALALGGRVLHRVLAAYPEMDFRIRSGLAPVTQLGRGAHCALTYELPATGDFMVRAVTTQRFDLFASGHYLEQNGAPVDVAGLRGHASLLWSEHETPVPEWPLRNGTTVTIKPRLVCSNLHVIREAAAASCGLALLPRVLGAGLTPVLQDAVGCERTIWWVTTLTAAADPRVQAVFDVMTAAVLQLFGDDRATGGHGSLRR